MFFVTFRVHSVQFKSVPLDYTKAKEAAQLISEADGKRTFVQDDIGLIIHAYDKGDEIKL